MAPVATGVYAVARPGGQLLTLQDGSSEPGAPALLLPPTGIPGEQEWRVEVLPNGNCTIRNLRGGTYLGFDGEPALNGCVGGYPESCEWALYRSSSSLSFDIVVPSRPVHGTELAVDLSLLKIYPSRIALRPLDAHGSHQAWILEPRE